MICCFVCCCHQITVGQIYERTVQKALMKRVQLLSCLSIVIFLWCLDIAAEFVPILFSPRAAFVNGQWCTDVTVVGYTCNYAPPQNYKEGDVCANEGLPNEAYCLPDGNLCAYCNADIQQSWHPLSIIGEQFGPAVAEASTSSLSTTAMIGQFLGFLSFLTVCLITCAVRGAIRRREGIKPDCCVEVDCCEDCMVAWCCNPCTQCMILRHEKMGCIGGSNKYSACTGTAFPV
jgi:hypothetical protein